MAYPICCSISNVFLLLTLVVYLLLPELREPLFGKIIMAFTTSLFFAYTWTIAVAIGHLNLGRRDSPNYDIIHDKNNYYRWIREQVNQFGFS
jgi:hypothetical protein